MPSAGTALARVPVSSPRSSGRSFSWVSTAWSPGAADPVQESAMAAGRASRHVHDDRGKSTMKHVLLAALMIGAVALPSAAEAQQTAITQSITGTRLDINATGEVTR